ncbi:hypothetical protein [Bradyrhizobium sp. F1.13.3]|uniref:hypothetical protein n=1 Tax=Bradyrhizobium sp. F1.13.3 TaxID=3156351 RepID=UPI003397BE39
MLEGSIKLRDKSVGREAARRRGKDALRSEGASQANDRLIDVQTAHDRDVGDSTQIANLCPRRHLHKPFTRTTSFDLLNSPIKRFGKRPRAIL